MTDQSDYFKLCVRSFINWYCYEIAVRVHVCVFLHLCELILCQNNLYACVYLNYANYYKLTYIEINWNYAHLSFKLL